MVSETETPAPPARPFADRRAFPMNYALMQPLPAPLSAALRVGASRRERAAMIVCSGFYKPVSRCFLLHSPPAPAGEADHGA